MEPKPFKLAAIMTAPRYEAATARSAIQNALRQLNIPLAVSGGCYYGQCMQGMMSDFVKKGADILLTIDGDSMITADNIRRLLWTMSTRPDIDACAAMQAHRGKPWLLLSLDCSHLEKGETINGEQWHKLPLDGSPIQVQTAHFGLTAIRAERLAGIERPWFWSTPDKDGNWDNDKVDDDIYFWKKWEANGRTVYIDPQCCIGHLEEMVSVFDDDMKIVHVYSSEWHRRFIGEQVEAYGNLEAIDVSGITEAVEQSSSGETVTANGRGSCEAAHLAGVGS